MGAFWQNEVFFGSIAAMLAAQLLKVVLHWLSTGKFDLDRLWNSGGMPSSHSAMIVCLTFIYGFLDGFTSSAFTISAIVALIVMYDATGIRSQAGKQAMVINRLVKELQSISRPGKIEQTTTLKELLGHRPLEVLGGGVLGVFVAAVVAQAFNKPALVVIFAAALIIFTFATVSRRLAGKKNHNQDC